MAKICQCCGQSLPRHLKLSVVLAPSQRRLVERVHKAGPNGILSTDLFDYLYSDDPDGGPLSGNKAIHVRICSTNKKLKLDGLRIRAPRGGVGGHTNYVLEKLRGDHAEENHA